MVEPTKDQIECAYFKLRAAEYKRQEEAENALDKVRDCGDEIELRRGDSKNWKAYKNSLKSRPQFTPPLDSSKCPKCGKYINGVNPYDDGETWRQ